MGLGRWSYRRLDCGRLGCAHLDRRTLHVRGRLHHSRTAVPGAGPRTLTVGLGDEQAAGSPALWAAGAIFRQEGVLDLAFLGRGPVSPALLLHSKCSWAIFAKNRFPPRTWGSDPA